MGIFNKIKKTKKTKEKKQNNNNLSYKLAGLYLNDSVDLTPIENKIAENTNNITENNNKIVENTNKINEQTNKINEHTLKINEHTTTLTDQNTRINNNINNIATNVNNINNINTKINKITNDLNNANLANYKGLYNNTVNYKLGDLVSDNNTHNVYLSVSNNNINNPLNNNNFWKIITFTVDTSNFITDSSLTPIRNNINNNSSEITNIKNRLDNITVKDPYFTTSKVINFTVQNVRYWTVGELRTFELDITSSETIFIPKRATADILFIATIAFHLPTTSSITPLKPISQTYFNRAVASRASTNYTVNIPTFTITVPTAWGTDIRSYNGFYQSKIIL